MKILRLLKHQPQVAVISTATAIGRGKVRDGLAGVSDTDGVTDPRQHFVIRVAAADGGVEAGEKGFHAAAGL